MGVGSVAQAENHSSGDPVVKEAQTILKNLGYEVGIIDGKYGRKTEGALKKFFKNLGKSYDGSLDTEELKILRDNPGNANATGKDYRICNGNFCTTQWGAWITKTYDADLDGNLRFAAPHREDTQGASNLYLVLKSSLMLRLRQNR